MKALFLSSALAVAALAAPATAGTMFATEVDPNQAQPVAASRSIPEAALGANDGDFLSLGLGGHADFTFGELFTGLVTIYETTFDPRARHFEQARIEVGLDGVFTDVTTIDNTDSASSFTVDGVYDTLRIVDVTMRGGPSRDGFDIDAVSATSVAAVPLPGAGLLLAGGLAGLAAARKRRA